MAEEQLLFIGLGDTGARLLNALPLAFDDDRRVLIDTDHNSSAPFTKKVLLGEKFLYGLGTDNQPSQTIKAFNMANKNVLTDATQGANHCIILADLGGGTGAAAPHLAQLLLRRGMSVSLALIAPLEADEERDGIWQVPLNEIRPQLNYCQVFSSPFQDSKKGRETLMHKLIKEVAMKFLMVLMAE